MQQTGHSVQDMLMVGETVHVWGQKVFSTQPLYFPLNFAAEPKNAKAQLNLKLNFAVKPKVALKDKVY